jgi:uncharacterized lipoprotein YddW (UPF0748 family)
MSISRATAQMKREFRGAWIQCVNGQFQGMGTQEMQKTLTYQLDELQKMGANAIIFQVRPECDALYESSLEPWSRFLTGQQGRAPQPYWDPLQWMITQCHQRGMELHAWINPYRAKTKGTTSLASNHVGAAHPERCFRYDDLLILNPGLPENRDYICQVARDIVTRYDVDGIHMDDYFYPYPVAGQQIPDDQEFRLYSNGIKDRGDWRRYNVNLFIRQFYETVHTAKPWVKVGISPFGIYRNKKSAAIGSQTNGLQNYDDLYADVLLWINNGWLDYCVPQIYWEIGNKAADYDTLIRWWNQYCAARPLYIGEDIERTVKHADLQNANQNQQAAKQALHLQMPNVKGTVLWYAKAAVDNTGNYATALRQNYWRYPALQPQMPFIDKKAPKAPRKVKPIWTSDGYVLFWTAPKGKKWDDVATRYVVYRFKKGEKANIGDPSKIVTITSQPFLKLPYKDGVEKYTYMVTALDRLQNESKPAKKNVKL